MILRRAAALLAATTLLPAVAPAQELDQLRIVRTDPTGAEDADRRRLTLTIRGSDWGVSYVQENRIANGGQVAWEARVQGSAAVARKARREELLALVARARAARPAGDISGSLAAAERAALPRYQVAIDGVRFELHGGVYASAAVKEGVGPLVAALDAMLEAHLPPPSVYSKLTYRRGGRVLEVSPTGNATLTTGADVAFHTLGEGPKRKLQALLRASGLIVPANQGTTVRLDAARPDAGGAFALEVQPLRAGAAYAVEGTVGAWRREEKAAGALIDELEAILGRIARRNEGASSGGIGGALEGR